MKIFLFVAAMVLFQVNMAFAVESDSKKVARTPSSMTCIKSRAVRCAHGYMPRVVSGCTKCVHVSVNSKDVTIDDEVKSCVTTSTLTCADGYRATKEIITGAGGVEKSCYHCTEPAISEPNCVKEPTIECVPGYEQREDEHHCFHCVK